MENNEPSDKPQIKHTKIHLSRSYRVFLYFVMICVEGMLNVSSGILSSASHEIKASLNLSETEFGSFGTALSLGRILGSSLFGMFNKYLNRKWAITISITIHSISLICYKFTKVKLLIFFLRGIQGFTQMPPSVSVPVWINQFGISYYKTIQMSSIQLFATSGKYLGFLINNYFGQENWVTSFTTEGFGLLIFGFCYLVTNEKYFSNTLYPTKKINDNESTNTNKNSYTSFEDELENEPSKKKLRKGDILKDLCNLITNKLFIICLLSRCIIHGLNTCLHHWLADFIRTIIPNEKQIKITICYSIICFAGPLGGLITNSFFKKWIGSYESQKSSFSLIFLQLGASIFACSIAFMNTTIKITICSILFFFFNSSVLPLIQGVLITSVDKDLSTSAFSLSSISTQILTSGTAPLLYGYIHEKYKNKYPFLAMLATMSIHFIAVPLLIILAIIRNKKFDDEKEKENDTEQELVDKNDHKV